MNRKERRAYASKAQKEGTLEDRKAALVADYGRLATQAGDLNYRVYVINKEMENIQRQHAALVAKEGEQPKSEETPDAVQAEAPAAAPDTK